MRPLYLAVGMAALAAPCLTQRQTSSASLPRIAPPSAPQAQNLGLQLAHGVDGYIEVPAAAPLTPSSGITLEAWVTYDDATLQPGLAWPTIVRQNLAHGAESYFMRVDAGNTSVRSLRWKVVTSAGLPVSASWWFAPGQMLTPTHVAGTYDGTTARLFINGLEVGQGAGAGTLRSLGGALRIGKGDDATANHAEVWNGQIDEVRLWPFARSAAEIQATMQQEIGSVPGFVSTWNLNGDARDASGGLHGSVLGAAAFMANTLTLTPFPVSGATQYGTGTTTCASAPDATVTCLPRVGNTAFALAGTRAPSNGSGVLLLSGRALPSPLVFLGAGVWVDPTASLLMLGVPSTGLGTTRVPLPIPNNSFLTRARLAAQFVWADTCGPLGLSASGGLSFGFSP
jgi:hypothetical protein